VNPLDVVITAAIEHAASIAHAAMNVQSQVGADAAAPLSAHSHAILDAVEAVRP
jgi:hypothetical protein